MKFCQNSRWQEKSFFKRQLNKLYFILDAISPCTTGLIALCDPAQVQPNSQVTNIPLTERQRLKDDHLSMSLRFLAPNNRGPPFEMVI